MIFTVACLTLLCHCVAGQYANEQDVLDAFTDVYDIMYSIRDDHAKQIQELRDNQAQFPGPYRWGPLDQTPKKPQKALI